MRMRLGRAPRILSARTHSESAPWWLAATSPRGGLTVAFGLARGPPLAQNALALKRA